MIISPGMAHYSDAKPGNTLIVKNRTQSLGTVPELELVLGKDREFEYESSITTTTTIPSNPHSRFALPFPGGDQRETSHLYRELCRKLFRSGLSRQLCRELPRCSRDRVRILRHRDGPVRNQFSAKDFFSRKAAENAKILECGDKDAALRVRGAALFCDDKAGCFILMRHRVRLRYGTQGRLGRRYGTEAALCREEEWPQRVTRGRRRAGSAGLRTGR
jgi:hypothetical protein